MQWVFGGFMYSRLSRNNTARGSSTSLMTEGPTKVQDTQPK